VAGLLPPMAMMPPTIVVAATSTPSVMMPAPATMSPLMATAMTVAAFDLDDRTIGAESIRCCGGHCGRCSSRSKATECSKSNKCKFEFHGFLPVAF